MTSERPVEFIAEEAKYRNSPSTQCGTSELTLQHDRDFSGSAASLLCDPRLQASSSVRLRVGILNNAERTIGNHNVHRLLQRAHHASNVVVQRQPPDASEASYTEPSLAADNPLSRLGFRYAGTALGNKLGEFLPLWQKRSVNHRKFQAALQVVKAAKPPQFSAQDAAAITKARRSPTTNAAVEQAKVVVELARGNIVSTKNSLNELLTAQKKLQADIALNKRNIDSDKLIAAADEDQVKIRQLQSSVDRVKDFMDIAGNIYGAVIGETGSLIVAALVESGDAFRNKAEEDLMNQVGTQTVQNLVQKLGTSISSLAHAETETIAALQKSVEDKHSAANSIKIMAELQADQQFQAAANEYASQLVARKQELTEKIGAYVKALGSLGDVIQNQPGLKEIKVFGDIAEDQKRLDALEEATSDYQDIAKDTDPKLADLITLLDAVPPPSPDEEPEWKRGSAILHYVQGLWSDERGELQDGLDTAKKFREQVTSASQASMKAVS
jgi:hypothetical protein